MNAAIVAGLLLLGSMGDEMGVVKTLLSERRDARAAESALRQLLKADPSSREANYLLAGALYDWRRFAEARLPAEIAVAADPVDGQARLLMGKIYAAQIEGAGLLTKLVLARKAKAEFESALRLQEGSIPARRALAGFLAQAPGIAGGDFRRAVAEARAIEKLDPAQGLALLCGFFVDRKEPDRALDACSKAASHSGVRDDILAEIGSALRRAGLDQAWGYLDQALALNPQNLIAGYHIARKTLERGGDLAQAERLLKANLARWPDERGVSWALTHWRLAQLFEKQGRREEAIQELEAALRQDPKLKGARGDLDRLRRLYVGPTPPKPPHPPLAKTLEPSILRLTITGNRNGQPSWLPDGRRVAYAYETDGNRDIWIMNRDGGGAIRVTIDPGRDSDPTWSPTGDRLIFSTSRYGGEELAVIELAPQSIVRE